MNQTGAQPKIRLDYMDAVRGFAIIMVMFGHITRRANPIDVWMSSFKLTIFFVVTGFLISHTDSIRRKGFWEFIKGLLRSLGIPYLWFSVFAIMARCYADYAHNGDPEHTISMFRGYVLDVVFLKGINSMWFIPAIFIGEIIFYFLIRSPLIIRILYGVLALFSVPLGKQFIDQLTVTEGLSYALMYRIPLVCARSLMAAWYIGAGYIIYKFYRKITDQKIKLLLGLILSLGNCYLAHLNNGRLNISALDPGEAPVFFFISGVVGSLGAILLIDFFIDYCRPLIYWGKNSMINMCVHLPFMLVTFTYNGWSHLVRIPDTVCPRWYLDNFIVLVLLMLLMYGINEIINQYFPFLLGRKKSKTAKG